MSGNAQSCQRILLKMCMYDEYGGRGPIYIELVVTHWPN